jgi:hypothetical protein
VTGLRSRSFRPRVDVFVIKGKRRKDGRKMSERDKKKKKCDYCQVPNFTKYDCRICDEEFCSDEARLLILSL